MRSFAVLLAAFALSACASAPAGPAGYLEILEGTTRLTCRGVGMDGAFGSRLARSPMLLSSAAERAAWVEIEAQALGVDADEGTCQNVSRLWVREGGVSRVAFVQKPGWEGRNGNAIDLIDWSPDGSRLLLELHTWTYPTDPVDPTLLVWNSATGAIEQVDAGARLNDSFDSDCHFRLRGKGFTAAGTIVFRAEAGEDAPATCAGAERSWVIPAASSGLTPASAEGNRWSETAIPPARIPPVDPE